MTNSVIIVILHLHGYVVMLLSWPCHTLRMCPAIAVGTSGPKRGFNCTMNAISQLVMVKDILVDHIAVYMCGSLR